MKLEMEAGEWGLQMPKFAPLGLTEYRVRAHGPQGLFRITNLSFSFFVVLVESKSKSKGALVIYLPQPVGSGRDKTTEY